MGVPRNYSRSQFHVSARSLVRKMWAASSNVLACWSGTFLRILVPRRFQFSSVTTHCATPSKSLSVRRLLRSRRPAKLRPQSFHGVPDGVWIGAPNGRSTHRWQLHGISENDAEAAEQDMLAIPHPLRRSALRGLLTSDAHEGEQALTYHGHLVDEDVVCLLYTSPSPRD